MTLLLLEDKEKEEACQTSGRENEKSVERCAEGPLGGGRRGDQDLDHVGLAGDGYELREGLRRGQEEKQESGMRSKLWLPMEEGK